MQRHVHEADQEQQVDPEKRRFQMLKVSKRVPSDELGPEGCCGQHRRYLPFRASADGEGKQNGDDQKAVEKGDVKRQSAHHDVFPATVKPP
jgi:hypothetical protein